MWESRLTLTTRQPWSRYMPLQYCFFCIPTSQQIFHLKNLYHITAKTIQSITSNDLRLLNKPKCYQTTQINLYVKPKLHSF